MEVKYCDVDLVQIGKRLRHLDQTKVDALAESMGAIGLQQPISVWSDSIDVLELVAGLHRLEAARKLGWEDIDCIFVHLDEIDRQLWEIDENLIRADLSPAELTLHVKRRKELWEERHKDKGGQTLPTPGGEQKIGFAKDTKDKTGTPKRTTNLAVSRATSIPADILSKIEGTVLDKGVYLDKLKKLSHDEQRAKVERDLDAIEQRKKDAGLKEEEKRRKEEATEQRRRDFADMGELLDKKFTSGECEWFLNTLSKYAGKTANDLRAWSNA